MSAIFVSHSSQDAAVAAEVRDWLVSEGHQSLFLDFDPEFGIPAGRSWEQELYHRLRSCRAVIVLCSRTSMASRWCFAEITQARALGKVLLPVRIDDCVIDALLAGQQVTDFGVDRIEGFGRLRRGLLAAGVDPADIFEWDARRGPYPGLLAFQEQDAAVFFGRAEEIGDGLDLLNRMRRLSSAGVVIVVGASGSGKSSLVRAGLVPRLRQDSERWLVVNPFRPRDDPVAELAAVWSQTFARVGESRSRADIGLMVGRALADPGLGNPLVPMAGDLRRAADRSEATVLVVVDQLEELLDPTSGDSAGVLRMLRGAGEASGCPLVLLATMRSDFLAAFQKHPALVDLRCEFMSVGPMSAEDVTQVIEGPATVAGLELESGLVQAMLSDTDTDDALPLLAFTLRELFDRFGDDGRLDVREYYELGGLHGALVRAADELVESQRLTPELDEQLRRTFLGMVRLTEDDRWVRRGARWDEFPDSIHPVLERFVKARLLVSGGDAETRTVEVAHEALFRSWGRLAGWLRRDAEALRLRRDVQHGAQRWATEGRDPADLWRGARLARAAELTRSGDLLLAVDEDDFIDASLLAEQADVRAKQRRRLAILGAICLAALVSAAFGLLATRRAAQLTDRTNADRADRVAAVSQDQIGNDDQLAVLLAREAVRIEPTDRARAALTRAISEAEPIVASLRHDLVSTVVFSPDGTLLATGSRPGQTRLSTDGGMQLWTAEGKLVAGFLEGISASDIAFSANSQYVAVAASDGSARVWTRDGDEVASLAHGGAVSSVAFAPADSTVATTGTDGTARLWSLDGRLLATMPHDDQVLDLAFSPDGRLIATAGADAQIRIWDTTGALQRSIPRGARVFNVAFSPDGSKLLSWTRERGTVIHDVDGSLVVNISGIWPVFAPTGDQLATIERNTATLWDQQGNRRISLRHDNVVSVEFSGDGRFVVTGGFDGTARVWALNGNQIGVLTHGRAVTDAASDRTGGLIATAGAPTVRLWRFDPQSIVDVVSDGPVSDAAFAPNGDHIATTVGESTIVYDETGRIVAHIDGHGPAFSPDGQLLVTHERDDGPSTVRLSDQNGDPAISFEVPGAVTARPEFSPDGSIVGIIVSDTLYLYDLKGRRLATIRHGPGQTISAIAFARGTLVATVGADGLARVWNHDGAPIVSLRHDGPLNDVAFAPGGDLVATAGSDAVATLWTSNGDRKAEMLHPGIVTAVQFSADARRLITTSGGYAYVWDGDGERITSLSHEGELTHAEFSATGSLYVTSGPDGTARVWDAGGTQLTVIEHSSAVVDVHLGRNDTIVGSVTQRGVRLCRCVPFQDVETQLELVTERIGDRRISLAEARLFLGSDYRT